MHKYDAEASTYFICWLNIAQSGICYLFFTQRKIDRF